ncbi:MAG: hypothetical protein ACRDKY_09495, partial [Solirubrobacteraceae bacterium]
MRAWRERPRVAVAALLVLALVVGVAGAAGIMLAGGVDDEVLTAEKRRSAHAQFSSRELSRQLVSMRGELSAARQEAATQHTAQEKANRKLKRARRRT